MLKQSAKRKEYEYAVCDNIDHKYSLILLTIHIYIYIYIIIYILSTNSYWTEKSHSKQ